MPKWLFAFWLVTQCGALLWLARLAPEGFFRGLDWSVGVALATPAAWLVVWGLRVAPPGHEKNIHDLVYFTLEDMGK